jgi:hypothetical protein
VDVGTNVGCCENAIGVCCEPGYIPISSEVAELSCAENVHMFVGDWFASLTV